MMRMPRTTVATSIIIACDVTELGYNYSHALFPIIWMLRVSMEMANYPWIWAIGSDVIICDVRGLPNKYLLDS